jgi:hypothetical protein
MATLATADVHHSAPRCLMRLFHAAAARLTDWSEFDAETECLTIEVRRLSCEGLAALIESSTREIPTTEHSRLHQGASDFVRWGRPGGRRTLARYGNAVPLAARPLPMGAHRTYFASWMAASPSWCVWRGTTGPGGNRLNARELYQSRRLNPPGPLCLNYRSVHWTTSWSSVASRIS